MLPKLVVGMCLAFAMTLAFAGTGAEAETERQHSEIAILTLGGNYAEIERRAEQEAARAARFGDGLWRLSSLYADFNGALQKDVHGSSAWASVNRRLTSLAKTRPKAWLLYAEALSARAWSTRGPGYASTVSARAWAPFKEGLQQARAVLDTHKSSLADVPTWYSLRLALATELEESEASIDSLFAEAVERHPAYHAVYFSRIRAAAPNWRGSKEKMLDVLDKVAGRTGKTASEGLYARLVWYADDAGFALTHSPRINMEAMQESSEALAKAFPDQWNVQKLFFMACEQSDKPRAVRMLAKVKEPPLASLRGRNIDLYGMCRDWAEGKLQAFIMNDRDGDEEREYVIQ